MNLHDLRNYPDHSVIKVVIQKSAVLANNYDPENGHRAVAEEVMFVVWHDYKEKWCVKAMPVEIITKHFDSEYYTMIEAVLSQGTILKPQHVDGTIILTYPDVFRWYMY